MFRDDECTTHAELVQRLKSFASETFCLRRPFVIQYQDADNDKVSINDGKDLKDALACAARASGQKGDKKLKLFVTVISHHDSLTTMSANEEYFLPHKSAESDADFERAKGSTKLKPSKKSRCVCVCV